MDCKFCPGKTAVKSYQIVRPDGPGPMVFLCADCGPEGPVTPTAPTQVLEKPKTLFDAWSDANQIMSDTRSRFDWLRENLPKAQSHEEARRMIAGEGFGERYPLVPAWEFT